MRNCPKCGKTYAEDIQFCPEDGSALGPGQEAGDPLVGTLLGNYRILKKLGEGGMGMVYRAEHTLIGRTVALKLLHPDLARNTEAVDRFFREARAANEVVSDHIVEVTDLGKSSDGKNYLVMELLTGASLQEVLQARGALAPLHAGRLALQIAEGLAAAHAKGVIHRDLKPANIQLVTKGGDPEFVKLLDFGIAKICEGDTQLTKTGVILGSPAYMSPEQASGTKIDHRTDIYALGVILYEMVAGKPPFVGQSPTQILLAHVSQQPTPPRTAVPDLPPELDALILDCLAKDPGQRPQDMAEFIRRLEAWTDRAKAAAPRVVGAAPDAAFAATAFGLGNDATLPPPPAAMEQPPGAAVTIPAAMGAESSSPIPPTISGPQLAAPAQSVATTGEAVTSQAGPRSDRGMVKGIVIGGVLVAVVSLGFFLLRGEGSRPEVKSPGDDPSPARVKAPAGGPATVEEGSVDDAAARVAAAAPAGEPPGSDAEAQSATSSGEVREKGSQAGAGAPGGRSSASPARGHRSPSRGESRSTAAASPARGHRSPSRGESRSTAAAAPPQPRPQPPARPQVTIQSTPPGAQIFGGGRALGQTPRKFYSDKGFTVLLKHQGYQPATVVARPGQRGVHNTRLTPLPAYQRTSSLGQLKQMYRARQMTRRQWKAQIKVLTGRRNRQIRAIKEAYKRGQFSRAERNRRIKAVKDHYR